MQLRDLLHCPHGINTVYMGRDYIYLSVHAPVTRGVELLEVIGVRESGCGRDELLFFSRGKKLEHGGARVLGRGELGVVHEGVVRFVVDL